MLTIRFAGSLTGAVMSPENVFMTAIVIWACCLVLFCMADWSRARHLPDAVARRVAGRALTRAQLQRSIFFACSLYAITFAVVLLIMVVSAFVVPHLPWISKPHVNPDPPPLITAFYCANFMIAAWAIGVPILYLFGMPILGRKNNARYQKT